MCVGKEQEEIVRVELLEVEVEASRTASKATAKTREEVGSIPWVGG